jgi:opacity protein-like surface antigen
MKKTLIALLALAGVAAAGTEETITLQPAPQTACTLQPEFSIEYLHGYADHKGEVDTDGIRAGFSIYTKTDSKFSHQFSLNLGYEWGDVSESHDGIIGKLDETKTSLTLGYDLNYALTEKFTVFVGAKAGWSLCDYEFSVPHYNFKWEQDIDGFTYSIGAGVKYQITESVHVKAGYEFNRIYLGDFFGENIIPNMHVISVGLGYKF